MPNPNHSASDYDELTPEERLTAEMLDEHSIDEDPEDLLCGEDPEREIEEDSWSAADEWAFDPEIDTRQQTCFECAEGAERRLKSGREWEIAGIAERFIRTASSLLLEDRSIDEIYRLTERIVDCLSVHPRLMLRLKRLQLSAIQRIEAREEERFEETDQLLGQIAALQHNIELADAGRLDEIGQTGPLKKDPVEWTERFEQVIDEVEQEVDLQLRNEPRGMGFCFVYWPAKTAALAARGVEWRSPHRMNPRVIFD